MSENKEEKLKKINEKMAKLKAQKKAMVNREKEQQRKERTRRLIQNGALAEQYLQCQNMDSKEFELFLKLVTGASGVDDLFQKCKDLVYSSNEN